MRLSEMKQKEVINIKDCSRLGFVGDVDIDICTGRVTASSFRDLDVCGDFWEGRASM